MTTEISVTTWPSTVSRGRRDSTRRRAVFDSVAEEVVSVPQEVAASLARLESEQHSMIGQVADRVQQTKLFWEAHFVADLSGLRVSNLYDSFPAESSIGSKNVERQQPPTIGREVEIVRKVLDSMDVCVKHLDSWRGRSSVPE